MSKKNHFYFDYSKLKGRMKEKNYTQQEGAKDLNMAKSTFNFIINNKGSFNQSQILVLQEKLEILDSEFKEYFFKVKV